MRVKRIEPGATVEAAPVTDTPFDDEVETDVIVPVRPIAAHAVSLAVPAPEPPQDGEPSQALVVAAPPGALTEATPERFREALDAEAEKRALLEAYIRDHLKAGVDWDRIRIAGKLSKPTLLKPGAEKICSLLHLRPVFEPDFETLRMLGEPKGVVAYRCTLVTTQGEVVGEGRAVAGSEKADLNTRVKMAEVRAQRDAVLRVAGLSDHFTQDLEEQAVEERPGPAAKPSTTGGAEASAVPSPTTPRVSPAPAPAAVRVKSAREKLVAACFAEASTRGYGQDTVRETCREYFNVGVSEATETTLGDLLKTIKGWAVPEPERAVEAASAPAVVLPPARPVPVSTEPKAIRPPRDPAIVEARLDEIDKETRKDLRIGRKAALLAELEGKPGEGDKIIVNSAAKLGLKPCTLGLRPPAEQNAIEAKILGYLDRHRMPF